MSDEKETPIAYTFGTGVWVKVLNRYWWPGIVVDPLTIPDELLEYVNMVNSIAVVKFIQETKYEVVVKNKNICLYSCDRKMEFVEKGLSLQKKQEKGVPLVGKFTMDNFRDDVILMEKRIGGDICIFENLEEKLKTVKTLVNILFHSPNTKKSKKKEVGRKSLPAPILPKSKPQPKPTPVSKQKTLPQSKVVQHLRPSEENEYTCRIHTGCTYTTKRLSNLKHHMAAHKNDTNQKIVKKSPGSTSNKRKILKTKLSDIKKIKLQEELLKDWENEGEDEELNTIDVQSTSQVVSTKNEGLLITSEVVPIINEVVQITSKVAPTMTDDMSTGKVLSSENDPIPTLSEVLPIASEIQETNTDSSNKVFEFNENDDNTPVVELRQNKLDISSTVVDDIIEKFESEVILDLFNNTIPNASTNESLIVEENKKDSNESLVVEENKKDSNESLVVEENKKDSNESLVVKETIKDSFNKTREIHSNEIDDETRNTNILLEKTVNTLDQINYFENSLSCISNSLNKSDANILTEDNNVVIGVSDFIKCESLKEGPTSPSKDIHIETDGTDVLVKNMSIQTEDREIVEQKTIKKKIVSDDEEVNGTAIDKNLPIENSCSVDSVSNNMECENETTIERNNQDCLLDLRHQPEYFNEDGWGTLVHNGFDKAIKFAVDSKESCYLSDCGADISTKLKDVLMEMKFTTEIQEKTPADMDSFYIEFIVPGCQAFELQALKELNASTLMQSERRTKLKLNPIDVTLKTIQTEKLSNDFLVANENY